MFTQTPSSTKSRFKALSFGLVPCVVGPERQAQAHRLAPLVRSIKPGIYFIAGHYVDLWRNLCTCREHRVQKIRPCRHRLALWLAEGVQIHDPDPAKYPNTAGVQEPAIIAWYATVPRWAVGQPRACVARWLGGECWQVLESGEIISRSFEELYKLTPFYE